jgi:SAM-dependent methyltransferase
VQHVVDDKAESRKQWDTDPCGAVTAAAVPAESPQWYASVREFRYGQYAPWMRTAIPFSAWRNRDVLEIGVGLGSDHLSFAEAGARMHALDLSAEHLRHTQRHLEIHGLATEGRLGDAEANPYPDASMDLVYSFGVLHHTPGTARAIAEALRVLRPGGTAIIGLYHRNSWFFLARTLFYRGILGLGLLRRGWRGLLSDIEYRSAGNDAVPLVKVYSRAQARRLMHGFEQVSISTHHVEAGHFPPPVMWLLAQWPRAKIERWFSAGGWYVMIRAQKPVLPPA